MVDSSSISLENMAQMLNFHGTQMLKEMCNRPPSSSASSSRPTLTSPSADDELDLVELYQQLIRDHQVDFRDSNLRMQKWRPNQREIDFYSTLRQFILKKLKFLFAKDKQSRNNEPASFIMADTAGSSSKEACVLHDLSGFSYGCDGNVAPSIQSFLDITSREQKIKYFHDVVCGDVVYAQVRSRDESGVTVKLAATDHRLGRNLRPLQIEVFIPTDDVIEEEQESTATSSFSKFFPNQYLGCLVMSVHREDQVMNLSLKGDLKLPLGPVEELDVPSFHLDSESEGDVSYDKVLRSAPGFHNPTVEETLCKDLGLENRGGYWSSSFLSRIRSQKKFGDPAEFSDHLRKDQTHKMSMKSVVKGVEKFKTGDNVGAMQHLTKALEIEEKNAEALVARGALHANQESFDLAIQDFKGALKEDPEHKNGKKYLIETLLTKARMPSTGLGGDDEELTRSLRAYYEKYNHRQLSAAQQKELSQSGILDKLKEYYNKYQRRNSMETGTHSESRSPNSSSDEVKILEERSKRRQSSRQPHSRVGGSGRRRSLTLPAASDKSTSHPLTKDSATDSKPKKVTQQDAQKLKKMEDFINQLKKKKT